MKNKRSTYGFTERQLWERAGVSRSTIQRFKRGDHLSDEMLKRVEKARRSLLKQEARALLKEAKSRLKELREFQIEAGYSTMGPAGEYFVNKIGLDVLKATGKSDEELRKNMGLVREFLDKKTSTVGGVKDWLLNVEEAAKKTSGLEDANISPVQHDEYWAAFNEIKNNHPAGSSKYFSGDGKFDSDQLQTDLKDYIMLTDEQAGYLSKEDLLDYVKYKYGGYIRKEYDKKGKDDLTF